MKGNTDKFRGDELNNIDSQSQDSTIILDVETPHILELKPGVIILERYRVIELLGRGGMGSVYKVESLDNGSTFALKFLHKQQTNDATWRRFDIEAKTSNKLDHPNLIKVHESGLLPDGQPFFIMDLVQGESLADILKTRGRLSVNQAVKIFIQVGFALSYAHANGVIHRDIKPSNIMLEKRPGDTTIGAVVKVVDFGIAKLTGKDEFTQMTLTKTGEIFGSPLYMSPEQCMGMGVDHRSDLYSLGCVMYESLTGAPPLMGESALSTMMKHQSEEALPLKEASLGIEYPDQIERIVARLLAKEVRNRYQSAQAFTSDLVNFDSGLDTTVPLLLKTQTEAKTTVRPLYVIKLLAVYILLLALGMYLGTRFPQIVKAPPRVHLADVPISKAALTETSFDARILPGAKLPPQDRDVVDEFSPSYQKKCHELISKLEKEPGFFSTIDQNKKLRIFRFPDYSLGALGATTIKPRFARGTLSFPLSASLVYTPNNLAKAHPRIFKKFRDDDIEHLFIKNAISDLDLATVEFSNSDGVLENIAHFRKLEELNMVSTDPSPKAWLLINNFKKLNILSLSHVQLSPKDIAKFTNFHQLKYFKLVTHERITDVLKKFNGSKNLRNLCVAKCNVTDEDAKLFLDIPNLEQLELRSTQVTDKGLRYMPMTLKLLDISYCKVTKAVIPDIVRLKNLRELFIDRDRLSSSEMHSLLRLCPRLNIQFAITGEEKHMLKDNPSARVFHDSQP